MMAPTEILATQHFESLTKMFSKSDLKIALLTGSTPAKQKREIKKALFNNEIDLLIGTHALIQNDVEFRKLALVITRRTAPLRCKSACNACAKRAKRAHNRYERHPYSENAWAYPLRRP